ncbi:MAG: FAD-dependent oxidoreductase [Chloroflexota bacterium]|nr:FAD-dependent oxidoreductase [Chloroflexota bacterium]
MSKEKQAQVEEVVREDTGKVYLPPCQIACPIGEDIQRTNVMISFLPLDAEAAHKQIIKIGDEIYKKNPLFTICSFVCGLCERECNYKDESGAVRRKMLKRFVNEHYLPYLDTKPALPTPTKDKVAVVGSGPGGLMCAYMLSEKGYRVIVFERGSELGGALRWIPKYRLPRDVLNKTLDNLVRIAHVEVRFGEEIGGGGKTFDQLKKEGFQSVFIATGTPAARPLTFGRDIVEGADLAGVSFGLDLLDDAHGNKAPADLFKGKKTIVVGGGNVAFDVARTARRLGGKVTLVCLECADKCCRDGIPADEEEIEGATEEGISIVYSRGVQEIVGENGAFKKIRAPLCTSVFDDNGFNPQFDAGDVIDIEGDVLLITIGQGPERALFQQEGLLNDRGRLDFDPLTLMSNRKEGIFVGGDMKQVGFAAEAMRDGIVAAESIDRFIKGEDLKAGREKEFEQAAIPELIDYKPQPGLVWLPAEDRLNFEPFEKGFTLEQAIAEAKRCLCCGPCLSCKACVLLELQPEIPAIEVNDELCSGCGVCVAVCPYDASTLEKRDDDLISVVDDTRCKRCSLCVVACPSGARSVKDGLMETIETAIAAICK